ncbi:hypothetical protein ACU4HD_13775 [Cupriavidus basilensis]
MFALLALGLLTLLARLMRWRPPGARQRGLALRAGGTGTPARRHACCKPVALAVGLMALLLLGMTRNDLISSWRNATPADAPNRFIINIQPGPARAPDRHAAARRHRRPAVSRWCADV